MTSLFNVTHGMSTTSKVLLTIDIVIIVVGLAVNILAFLVFSKQYKQKRISSTFLLLHLTIWDWIQCLVYIVETSNPEIRSNSQMTKNVVVLIYYIFAHCIHEMTNWSVVLVAADRFIHIHFPLRSKNWNTIRVAKIIIPIIFVLLLIITSLIHSFSDHHNDGLYEDYETPSSFNDLEHILTFFMFSLNLMALLLLFIFNIIVITDVIKATRSLIYGRNSSINRASSSGSTLRVTIMVLCMTCIFFVLKFPYLAWLFTFALWNVWDVTKSEIKLLLNAINSTVNFFIYVFSNAEFRRDFVNLCKDVLNFIIQFVWRHRDRDVNNS